jgi:hypothetical protein
MGPRFKTYNAILAEVLAQNSIVLEQSEQCSKNGIAFEE